MTRLTMASLCTLSVISILGGVLLLTKNGGDTLFSRKLEGALAKLEAILSTYTDKVDCPSVLSQLFSCDPIAELLQYEQDDPKLVEIVKQCVIIPPPSVDKKTEQFPIEDLAGQFGQAGKIDKLYKNKRNGFFVEVGAHNGKYLSNTLLLEQYRDWTGLLIEPQMEVFPELAEMGRNAYLAHTCLSTEKKPALFYLDDLGIAQLGKVLPSDLTKPLENATLAESYTEMTCMVCIPTYTLLLAIGNPTVDLFVLDIEGAEMPVIETLPLDKIDVKMWLIEIEHMGRIFNGSADHLNWHMEENGYSIYTTIQHEFGKDLDRIYVKNETLALLV